MQRTSRPTPPGRRLAAVALCFVAGTAGLALAAAPAAGQTSTVNFNTLTVTDGSGLGYVNNCYVEAGFQVAAAGVACGTPLTFATGSPDSPLFYTGSPALFLNDPTATQVDFTRVGGGAFGLQSLGLGAFLGSATSVTLVGSLVGGGSVMQMFSVPGSTLMNTFAVNAAFTGLTSVRLSATNANGEPVVHFDNLVFTGAATTVPEPGTVVLVAGGLLGAGLVARRRRGTPTA